MSTKLWLLVTVLRIPIAQRPSLNPPVCSSLHHRGARARCIYGGVTRLSKDLYDGSVMMSAREGSLVIITISQYLDDDNDDNNNAKCSIALKSASHATPYPALQYRNQSPLYEVATSDVRMLPVQRRRQWAVSNPPFCGRLSCTMSSYWRCVVLSLVPLYHGHCLTAWVGIPGVS